MSLVVTENECRRNAIRTQVSDSPAVNKRRVKPRTSDSLCRFYIAIGAAAIETGIQTDHNGAVWGREG